MTDAPLGGSTPQADLKKGSPCRQTSSPVFKPSHIPLKSCTFSSSRDMISVSFCFNRSGQQRQREGGRKRDREWGKHFVVIRSKLIPVCFHTSTPNVFLSPLISLALVSSCLLSSSVSLGIPSSSSLSLSNQAKEKKQTLQLINYTQICKPTFQKLHHTQYLFLNSHTIVTGHVNWLIN